MTDFNLWVGAGNLTRDPEVRALPGGAPGAVVAKFGIAVNRKWKDGQGQQREEVLFLDVESWGKLAEVCGQYLTRGRGVLVQGRLKLDQWDDAKTGEKRSKIVLVATEVKFLADGKSRADADQGEQRPAPAVQHGARGKSDGGRAAPDVAGPPLDDEPPF